MLDFYISKHHELKTQMDKFSRNKFVASSLDYFLPNPCSPTSSYCCELVSVS